VNLVGHHLPLSSLWQLARGIQSWKCHALLANRFAAPGCRFGRPEGPGDGQLRSTVANTQRPEAEMAKKSRKKKARRKNAANHGKRPNA
jgi:hypothetical protein